MDWIPHKTVQEHLKCTDRTLRNYCLLLERNGHEFEKDPQGKRLFSSDDLSLLQRMIDIREQEKVSFEEAAFKAVEQNKSHFSTVPDTLGAETADVGTVDTTVNMQEVIQKVDQLLSDPMIPLELYRDPNHTWKCVQERWNQLKTAFQSQSNR